MKRSVKVFLAMVAAIMQLVGPYAYAADSAQGTMNISGNVPVVFSLTTRGYPGDLDLSPNVSVVDRLIGIIHVKYNVDLATLNMASNTTSGSPENASNVAYDFDVAWGFKFLACTTVDATYEANFTISNVATDIKDSATTTSLTNGVEEDCKLTAKWGGTTSSLPLAGVYSMTITFTMTSI